MSPPKFPTGGNPPMMSLDEFKPIPCQACGERRRQPLDFIEHHRHRFKQDHILAIARQVWVCLGCGAQVSAEGIALGPEHPDRLPDDVLEALK